MSMTTKMKAHPSAMSKISHHANGRLPEVDFVAGAAGVSMPVMVGRGGRVLVPEGVGTSTRSERQIPRPGITLEEPLQLAETQVPPRRI